MKRYLVILVGVILGQALLVASAPAHPGQDKVLLAVTPKLELLLQTGHTRLIASVSLSRDGKLAATGSYDKTAILWDTQTGQILRTFKGHSNYVTFVSLSKDGKRLATAASTEKAAILWDTQTGQKLHTFPESGWPRLSGDGKLAATLAGGQAHVWDMQTGKKLHTFGGKPNDLRSICLSEDGKRLATNWSDKTAILWDTQTGQKLQTFLGHTENVYAVSLSADGKRLATGSQDKTVILWDTATGQKLQTFQASDVRNLSLIKDGKQLVTGAVLWDTQSGKKLQTLPDDGPSCLSDDASRLITGKRRDFYAEHSAFLWDAQTGQQLQVLKGHRRAGSLSLSGNGRLLTTTDSVGAILWDTQTCQQLHTWQYQYLPQLSVDGKRTLTTGVYGSNQVSLWNTHTGQKLHTFTGRLTRAEFLSVSLSRDHKLLVTLAEDKTALLWDAETGKKLRTFPGHPNVEHVHLSDDGKLVVTTDKNGKVMLWDAQTGQKRQTFQQEGFDTYTATLSSDGKRLATTYFSFAGDGAFLWDSETGKMLRAFQGHKGTVLCVNLSGDGKRLVTGSADFTAILWDTQTGKKLQTFQGTGGIHSTTLSADGKRLLTFAWDGTLCLWDVETAKALCSVISVDRGKDWLIVTPDGYFDGSVNAAKFVSYRIAGTIDLVPLERYRKQFERPGLLALIMKGEEYRSKDLKQDPPPSVRIVSAAKETKDGKLTVEAQAETRGEYPVTTFRLLVNGRPYPQKLGVFQVAEPKTGKTSARWDIELEPGKHTLEVLAYTKAVYAESEPFEVRYVGGHINPKVELPTLYILAVGISKYPAKADRLEFAHRDAEAVAKAYQTHSKALFQKIAVKVLTDEQATRDEIMDGLEWLRRSMTQKDFGVFFFAGHGVKDERDTLYFLPVNYDKTKLARSAIDGDVLARELTSTVGQLTVILDACHSGAIGGNKFRGLTDGILRDLTSEEKGIAMMCSASGREKAQESNAHQHGMFTAALLEGLAGKSNGKTGKDEIKVRLSDGAVYFKQLDSYVTERVRELSRGEQHAVTCIPRGFRDFPVSRP